MDNDIYSNNIIVHLSLCIDNIYIYISMVNISVRRRSILARFPTSSCGTISSMALLGRMPSCGIQNMCFCCLKINVHSPTWHLYFLDSICICVLYKYIYIYIHIVSVEQTIWLLVACFFMALFGMMIPNGYYWLPLG
jgi:hypothetical protein